MEGFGVSEVFRALGFEGVLGISRFSGCGL